MGGRYLDRTPYVAVRCGSSTLILRNPPPMPELRRLLRRAPSSHGAVYEVYKWHGDRTFWRWYRARTGEARSWVGPITIIPRLTPEAGELT
jgi:hypothetical protein